nr:MAG TPA: DNA N-6-adenine-methyltransferase [Caudoviricetes sp.]
MADNRYIDQSGQTSLFSGNEEYEAFVRKFEPKKTTDDCYTPPEIYEVIRDWACKEYGIDPGKIVRPFYPGGDYEAAEYPDGCCVLDNPPFSILSQICAFYLARNTQFFLFAPSLTAFGGRANVMRLCHIVCDANITYANGVVVRTAFVANLEPGCIARTAPDLGKAIAEAADKLHRAAVRELPKYTYPSHILTAAMLQRYSKYGIDLRIRAEDCRPISALDTQRAAGKAIFGGAPLIGSGRRREGRRNGVAAEPTGAADGCRVGRWARCAAIV